METYAAVVIPAIMAGMVVMLWYAVNMLERIADALERIAGPGKRS